MRVQAMSSSPRPTRKAALSSPYASKNFADTSIISRSSSKTNFTSSRRPRKNSESAPKFEGDSTFGHTLASSPQSHGIHAPPSWVMNVIPMGNLRVLESYKYQGTDLSLLVELFLRRFWNWLIEFFPLWLAPNLITTLGFTSLIITYMLAIWWAPRLDVPVPRVLFLIAAVSQFVYQTFDNLDGKQARRTSSSSPLGEMFDHGCDSLFLTLVGPPLALALGYKPYEATILFAFSLIMFYAAHWEEYYSHHLVLGRLANPTESQVVIMAVFIFSAVVGPSWFRTETVGSVLTTVTSPLGLSASAKLPTIVAQLSINHLVAFGCVFGCLYATLEGAAKLWVWSRAENRPFAAVIPTILPVILQVVYSAFWVAASHADILSMPLVPLLLIALASEIVIVPSTPFFLEKIRSSLGASRLLFIAKHTYAFWLLSGLISSYLTIHIMICRITRMSFGWFHSICLIPLFGALHAIAGAPFVSEEALLFVLLGVTAVYYVYYVVSIAIQLAYYLNIYVFKIK